MTADDEVTLEPDDDTILDARLELANRDCVDRLVVMLRNWNCHLYTPGAPAGLVTEIEAHTDNVRRIIATARTLEPPQPPALPRRPVAPSLNPGLAPVGRVGPVVEVDARAPEPDTSPTDGPSSAGSERPRRDTDRGMGTPTIPVPRPKPKG